MNKFEQFRMAVPAAEKQTYLDTCSTGLIPDFVYEAVARYQEDRYQQGGDSIWRYDDGEVLGTLDMMARSKRAIAQMIGADGENIVFGQNASQIYSLFSGGMYFEPGDNVVLPEGGWIANRFAWQRREEEGLRIRYAKPSSGILTPEEIFACCDARTRAVCIPLVEPSTGFAADAETIGAFCREHDIWFAVDGVQALGVLPVDVKAMHIDFLAGNDYKWMMNYCGTGYGYISPQLQASLIQRAAGWMSDDERFNTAKETLRLRADAGRFELGFPTVSGIQGIGLVAEKYNELGGTSVRDYIFGLLDYLEEKLAEAKGVRLYFDFPKKNRSAIAVLLFEAGTALTNEKLKEAGVCASLRPLGSDGRQTMRLSFHYYNNRKDVDRLIEVINGKGTEK